MDNHIKYKELTEFIKNNINSNALKVEKQNAIAMTEGFWKDNKHYYVTIFTSHRRAIAMQMKFRDRPKILTAMSTEPCNEHPLSRIGEELDASNYKDQYVAVLDRIFHITNDIKIWEKFCHNGVFDIWEPLAPFNSLNGKTDQMILLLRIFQIDCDLTKQIVRGTRHNSITDETVKFIRQNVNIVRPIIPNNKDDTHSSNYDGELYFEDIIEKISDAVSPYLKGKREEIVEDTSKYLISRTYPPPDPRKAFENAIKKLNEKDLKSNDAEIKTLRRTEQDYLRSQLFKGNEYFECGICGNKYPVLFLVAAHIKKRSECTLKEQNDKSIVMPMCNFGCDELYENGYISVKQGKVVQIKKEPLVQEFMDKIKGNE